MPHPEHAEGDNTLEDAPDDEEDLPPDYAGVSVFF